MDCCVQPVFELFMEETRLRVRGDADGGISSLGPAGVDVELRLGCSASSWQAEDGHALL